MRSALQIVTEQLRLDVEQLRNNARRCSEGENNAPNLAKAFEEAAEYFAVLHKRAIRHERQIEDPRITGEQRANRLAAIQSADPFLVALTAGSKALQLVAEQGGAWNHSPEDLLAYAEQIENYVSARNNQVE